MPSLAALRWFVIFALVCNKGAKMSSIGWGRFFIYTALAGMVAWGCSTNALAGTTVEREALSKKLGALLDNRDAAIIAAPDGRILAEVHADRLLVPASILKVVTALAALHYLGEEHRFVTDFYLNPEGRLVIKGYGDPLLVSERVAQIASHLSDELDTVNGLILDDTYFADPIVIPGRGASRRAYDAPNGALCVNFNTFAFQRQNGRWNSTEPQTPLLPFMIGPIERSGLNSGRITLAGNRNEILRYSGELFAYFFNANGIATHGSVVYGRADPLTDTHVWRYVSEDPMTKIISDLLVYSNNFIANQLLLAIGAHDPGPPATVANGVAALQRYYAAELGITTGQLVEASGLSRQNQVSARAMLHVLDQFKPHYTLMRQQGRQWYKTGTLQGVNTRAGYLTSKDGGLYRFVVMLNTPGKTTDRVMRLIERELD
jgi:serine-type D-Ala-D-Ala carboxypeptidase/endopeptidase (penicillin-binding protein 4)